PVPDLVAEALHHDRPVRRKHPRGLTLLAQVGDEVVRRTGIEVEPLAELLGLAIYGPARELANGAAQLDRPPNRVALPERNRSRQSGRRRHDHAIARDLLDSPCRGAEQEGLTWARLVNHLLVELADPAAVRQVHAV